MIVLGEKFDLKSFEKQVRSYYSNSNYKDIIKRYINDSNNFDRTIGFVDGPPTMNGEPHLGHIRGRIVKDMWYRKLTLEKIRIIFRPGWDSQGLPVELQAEKVLGLTGNKTDNLRKVGVEKLVETCKKIIHDYNKKWLKVDNLLGMSFDYDKSYWTYSNSYIEKEWKYIKKAFDNEILKEWFRVVAVCPSCETSLSNAEINQSYEQVEDPSFYYKVKLENSDLFLIVWTTMPFTLVTDELIGVNPEAKYLILSVRKDNLYDEKWIISESRIDELASELKLDSYEILDTLYGKELDGHYYVHPLIDLIPRLKELALKKEIHFVVAEDFVDVTTGSGIVHLSPANGEQDFEIATKRNIPIFVPIDDRIYFTEEAGKYKNRFVRDTDKMIVDDISKIGATVKISKIIHKYPTCWRSHHKIVWLAKREYFYMINQLEEKPVEAALNVNYYYEQPKNRFLEIIKEKVPWCISRERLWGTPLPIWKCTNCLQKKGLFSRKEIIQASIELPDGENFELHRPWIDRIRIKCTDCQSDMQREPFVLDTWHNSGSAPYSSFNDEEYDNLIPAEFLTEGIDQTRGWAYTLLMLNVIFSETPKSPFKSFLFTGHVLDEKGDKMSKSLGNVIDAYNLLINTPVDLVRFYMMWKSSPIEAINFNVKEMSSRPHQILSTLFYLHVYYHQNSTYDKFYNVSESEFLDDAVSRLNTTDKWIITKLEKLIINTTESINNCRFHEAAHFIEDFVINSLSQTYVPLIRHDLWSDDSENQKRRFTVYKTLLKCLKTIDIILHPFCPYITEYLYQSCFRKFESILMEKWPQTDDLAKISDHRIENAFDIMKEITSLSYSLRNKSHLKRRWPLESAYIFSKSKDFLDIEGIHNILLDQMNVDHIFLNELAYSNEAQKISKMLDLNAPIIPNVEINRRAVAKRVRSDINLLTEKFERVDKINVLKEIIQNGVFHFNFDEEKSINLSLSDLIFSYKAWNNFIIGEKDDLILILDTSRNEKLITKGMIRDLARNIQQLRKEMGYNPTQILDEVFISNMSQDEITRLNEYTEDIRNLVRVNHVHFSSEPNRGEEHKQIELDGKEIQIYIH